MRNKHIKFLSSIVCFVFALCCFNFSNNNVKADTLTPIMGQATLTKQQAFSYFRSRNQVEDLNYLNNFINATWNEGKLEGVRPDIAFIQMMKETNFLKFTGDVRKSQNNFAGIGAVGGGARGNSFPNMETGIRVVIQHLKAYASTQPLNNECVDPRYQYVKKGICPYVEWLGIGENPNYPNSGWATDKSYGTSIVYMLNQASKFELNPNSIQINNFYITKNNQKLNKNILDLNTSYKFNCETNNTSNVLYKFTLKNLYNNETIFESQYSSNPYLNWTFKNSEGKYAITVDVKKQNSNSIEDSYTMSFVVAKNYKEGFAKIQTYDILNGNKAVLNYNLKLGTTYKIKAYASSPNKVLYQFVVKDVQSGQSSVIKDYSDDRYAEWTANKMGKYNIIVNVKDVYSKQYLDDKIQKQFSVIGNTNTHIQTYDIMLNNKYIKDYNLYVGNDYTIKAYANGDNEILYEYLVKNNLTNKIEKIQDYSNNRYAKWTPSEEGSYTLIVRVKNKFSSSEFDSQVSKNFNLYRDRASIKTYDIMCNNSYILNNELTLGKSYTIKGYAESKNGVLYQLWVKDMSTRRWTKIQDFSSNLYLNWTPKHKGKYIVAVNVKDKNSSASLDGRIEKTVIVK